jgi:hypothetical protein
MDDRQCGFRKILKMVVGMFLLAMGLSFFLLGFGIFPVIGFFFALPLIGMAVFVFRAPRDRACVYSG